jgi:hypothetical protein
LRIHFCESKGPIVHLELCHGKPPAENLFAVLTNHLLFTLDYTVFSRHYGTRRNSRKNRITIQYVGEQHKRSI